MSTNHSFPLESTPSSKPPTTLWPREESLADRASGFLSGNSTELAAFIFVIACTVYHLWPTTAFGAVLLVINIVIVVRFPSLLVWIITYGYLGRVLLAPEMPRAVFIVPILLAFARLPLQRGIGMGELRLKWGIVWLCIALLSVALISEVADPVVRHDEDPLYYRLIDISLCIVIAVNIKTERERWFAIQGLIFTSVAFAGYFTWFALANHLPSLYTWHVKTVGSPDPNYLAFAFCLGLGPLIVRSTTKPSPLLGRVLSVLFALVIVWGMLYTSSRMGSILIGVIIITGLLKFRRRKLPTAIALVFIAIIVILSYPYLLSTNEFSELDKRWTSETTRDASGRKELVTGSLEAFSRATPVQKLLGAGNQANFVLLQGSNTHNSYLEYLLDHGVIGLGLMLAFLVVSLRNVFLSRSSMIATSMWTIWLTLVISSFALSPFAQTWGWAAIGPLLLSPGPVPGEDTTLSAANSGPAGFGDSFSRMFFGRSNDAS